MEEELVKLNTNKTPYELLSEVGYILYKCETKKNIQNFLF